MGTSSSSPFSSCCLADGPRAGRESKQGGTGGGNADEPCFSVVLQPRREIQTLKNGTVVLQDRAIAFGDSDIVARMEVDGPAVSVATGTPAARRAAARRRGGARHSQATRPVLRFRITTPVELPVDVASGDGTRHTVEVQLSETNLVHGCTVSGGAKPGSQWGAEKGAYAVVASAFFEVIAYEFPPPREPCVVALTFTRKGLLYDGELVFERASPPGYVAPEEGRAEGCAGGPEGPEGVDRGRVEGRVEGRRKPGKSSSSKSRKENKKKARSGSRSSVSGSKLSGGSSKDGKKGAENKTEKKEKSKKDRKDRTDRKDKSERRRELRGKRERKRGETEEKDGAGKGSEGRGALALAANAH